MSGLDDLGAHFSWIAEEVLAVDLRSGQGVGGAIDLRVEGYRASAWITPA